MNSIVRCVSSRIIAADVLAGELEKVLDPRAPAGSAGYGYLFGSTIPSCLPFGLEGRDVAPERLAPFRVSDAESTSVFPANTSASEMASDVANRVLSGLPGPCRDAIGGIIYCHSSLDESLDSVPVTRLSVDVALDHVMWFAVSQYQNCSVFAALRIARSLLQGAAALKGVLIIAADKWRYPFLRSFGALGSFGDAAAVMAVVADDTRAGFTVKSIAMSPSDCAVDVYGPTVSFDLAHIVSRAADALGRLLCASSLAPCDLAAVIHPGGPESLPRRVAEAAGLRDVRVQLPENACLHLSSADPIAGLTAALRHPELGGGSKVLWWNFGVRGEIGCALLERCDAGSSAGHA